MHKVPVNDAAVITTSLVLKSIVDEIIKIEPIISCNKIPINIVIKIDLNIDLFQIHTSNKIKHTKLININIFSDCIHKLKLNNKKLQHSSITEVNNLTITAPP